MPDDPIPRILDEPQRCRAAALRLAAEVYDHNMPRPGLMQPAAAGPRQKVSHRVWALTQLATFILDGAEDAAAEWEPGEVDPDAQVIVPPGWQVHDGDDSAVEPDEPPIIVTGSRADLDAISTSSPDPSEDPAAVGWCNDPTCPWAHPLTIGCDDKAAAMADAGETEGGSDE